MKTIGILGGLGPESTAEYYTKITRGYHELRGDYGYPEIVVLSLSFAPYIDCGYEAAGDVKSAIDRLAAAGADFVVAACNSVHIVYDEVAPVVNIPWVSIVDAAAEAMIEAGVRRAGLLGTRFTMTKGFYQRALEKHGIETVIPDPSGVATVNRIIFDELVVRDVRDSSREAVLGLMDGLVRDGAEGVVLGCTELPFLVRQEDTAVPVFDTTAIHCRKALGIAMGP